ncbi:MAG: YfhO family protein [Candidatus Cloacimonetes bacterium]|nr:YfhO family protein [Candidatus Cloacimonadota bacterium]
MAKRKSIPPSEPRAGKLQAFSERLHTSRAATWTLGGILFLFLVLWLFNISFRGYVPQASDTIHWKGSSQVLRDYNDTHSDQALWTPNIFSGMPAYMIAFPPRYPFLNEMRLLLSHVVNWRVLTLFAAGLGVYLLLLMLGFEPLVAFLGAAGFALSCHFIGLIQIGHNTKIRAIAFIPWIFLSWLYLKDRLSLLGLGLLAVFLISQFRENHPQIVYYTLMLLGVTWVFQLVQALRNDERKQFVVFTAMVLAAALITALAVANPYVSIKEYSDYTIRDKEGLDTGYAQAWSFHPFEMITFVAPNWFGGTGAQYWGWMPGQEVSVYMGIVLLLLALVGVFWGWRQWLLVRVLSVVSVIALLVSFGRHMNWLSLLLLKYLPYFDKFRVPAMALALVEFAVVVLAAYGVRLIIEKAEAADARFARAIKIAMIALPVLFVLFLAGRGIVAAQGLEHANDASRYAQYPQYLEQLKTERLAALTGDLVRAFVFMGVFLGLTWAFVARKLGKYSWLWLVVILVVADLMVVDTRFLRVASNSNPSGLIPESELDNQSFAKTKVDEYLLADTDVFRILPIAYSEQDMERRNLQMESNRWASYHQSIWGYHPSKLKRYNEILQNCMYKPTVHWFPFNMNVVNMLNTKYILHPKLPRGHFRGLSWRMSNLPLYENLGYLPRAWFVDSTFVADDKQQIFDALNDQGFNPATTAILESPLDGIAAPDSAGVTTDHEAFALHNIAFDVHTDKRALLVVSEVYYPAGWHAYIDGEETPIVPVNYILRGVVIPQGEHRVEMVFAPASYAVSAWLSLIGLLLATVVTIIGAVLWYRRNFRGQNVYVLK